MTGFNTREESYIYMNQSYLDFLGVAMMPLP